MELNIANLFEFDFGDFSSIVNAINYFTDMEKTKFIINSKKAMNEQFNTLFAINDFATIKDKSVYKKWFESREYLILACELDRSYLYCVYCLSFANKNFNLCKKGLEIKRVTHITQALQRHDKCKYHQESINKFNTLVSLNNSNIEFNEQILSVQQNRYLVGKVIRILIYVTTSGNDNDYDFKVL